MALRLVCVAASDEGGYERGAGSDPHVSQQADGQDVQGGNLFHSSHHRISPLFLLSKGRDHIPLFCYILQKKENNFPGKMFLLTKLYFPMKMAFMQEFQCSLIMTLRL